MEHPTKNMEDFHRHVAYFQYLWLERYRDHRDHSLSAGHLVEELMRQGWRIPSEVSPTTPAPLVREILS